MFRRVAVSLAVGAALFGFAPAAPPAQAADFTLRLSHSLPAAHLRQKHAELLRATLARASDNRIEVQIFPAGQLYRRDDDAIKAVRSGAIEGAMVTGGDLSLFEPSFTLYEAPFLIGNYRQLDALTDSAVGREILGRLERVGIKGLVYTDAGSAIIGNKLRPINSVDDFKGMRLRASAGQLQIQAFQLLGVSAIQLPFGEVAPSLQRGVIDGILSTPSASAAGRIGTLTRYGTWTRQQFFVPVVALNLAWWNRLPADIRSRIEAALPAFTAEARRLNLAEETAALETLKQQGMQITELSDAARAAFRERLAPVYASVRQHVGEDLYRRALAVIDSAR